MRTTLTLDDDIAAAIERLRKTSGQTLKALINKALREGLKQMRERPKQKKPFRTQAVALGRVKTGGIDNIAEVLALAEGESFR